jgi:hypothetical protein
MREGASGRENAAMPGSGPVGLAGNSERCAKLLPELNND